MSRRDHGVTVRDVAEHAGVGLSTVSNAINHPERLAATTLAKVQDSISALGFVRNDAARQLRLGRSRVFGLVVIDAGSPFFTVLERAAEDAADRNHYAVLLGNSGQEPDRERRYIELFESQRVQGLFVTPLGHDLHLLAGVRERGTPVVLIDYAAAAPGFPAVAVDHMRGGRIAAEHLLELGRRSIGLIEGPVAFTQVRDRYRGAVEAADAVGATTLSIPSPDLTIQGGVVAAHRLLGLPRGERPDAVFAPNDLVALGLMETLAAAGVAIPEEIAIIGYDDVAFAASARIPISSMRQPAEAIGAAAVELMMEAVADPGSARRIAFVPELIARRSTLGN
ncbi:LacI family transcriptional regulator [Leucobacter allii]|uniref:LacI family DNA-binding transcriptional regulator n=1 Tax=Leucobacter allii TaxID=2932247 RepID=UPI001FD4FE1A|nr:LacI family DNA-binding transcriptional regulator [Leucobacter allii]UOR00451.1 LacI family transcriptional regulator [Leucobacter allii]